MRVSKSGPRREKPVVPRKEKRESGAVSPVFSQVLQEKEEGPINLAEVLAEIDECARKLKESPVYENLLRYKRKIQAILRLLIRESFSVKEQRFYDLQGRRRQFFLVESINEKLEELTASFLSDQVDGLKLVSRLDEIRGLLLDLYT